MPSKTTSRKSAAGDGQTTSRSVAKKPARSSAGAAVKKSAEIKPRRAVATTAERLKSPKVLVPLTVAVGLGVAAVTKLLQNGASRKSDTLPRLTKEISPRFSEAVQALAELGRELRAKMR